MTMRIAVFGAGGWGRNHVRTFCSLLGPENVVVCDPDPVRLEAMREAHPGIETCDRPRRDGVGAVVIAAPAVTHHELARDALRDGLHVLVEKPMTLTSAEAEELVHLAEETERVLMVDHLLEYHPGIVELKRRIDAGDLGRLLHLTSRRLNLGVIRSEENALWSLAPHDISVILCLLNEEPVRVRARGETYLQDGICDLAHVDLVFGSSVSAHVHVSWLDPVKVRSLSVVGEEKMAVFDAAGPNLTLFDAGATREADRFVPRRGDAVDVPLPAEEPLRTVAEAFLRSIETGTLPLADGRDGLRVVRVLEAAQASLDAGGETVRIGGNR